MKLRILDNSIRLRLTRSEVDTASESGVVRGRVRFPGGHAFDYVLESSPASVSAEAEFSNDELKVRLPASEVSDWAASDQVSIAHHQALAGGDQLQILVEKDFACLSPREEDESDMFPHPMEGREQC